MNYFFIKYVLWSCYNLTIIEYCILKIYYRWFQDYEDTHMFFKETLPWPGISISSGVSQSSLPLVSGSSNTKNPEDSAKTPHIVVGMNHAIAPWTYQRLNILPLYNLGI